jgi:hypothetical protein
MDGRRHPFWPPTFLLMQVKRAGLQVPVVVAGDFSQTSPVFRSNTAALAKFKRIINRVAAGNV